MLLESDEVIDVPSDARAISAIFEELVVARILPIGRRYGCVFEEGGGREYPDVTLRDIPSYEKKIAIDIKTSRKLSETRIRGFTIGTYMGYFRTPNEKGGMIRYPYNDYGQHWIIGICYNFEEYEEEEDGVRKEKFRIVGLDVVIQEKWRIASRGTGSGTTKHMRSVTNIEDLKKGRGDFDTREEFLNYWRNY